MAGLLSIDFRKNALQKLTLFFALFEQRTQISDANQNEQYGQNTDDKEYKIVEQHETLHKEAPQVDCSRTRVSYLWAKVNVLELFAFVVVPCPKTGHGIVSERIYAMVSSKSRVRNSDTASEVVL